MIDNLSLEDITLALVVATVILAVGTFMAAWSTRRLAKTTEREFRATRLPLVGLHWSHSSCPQSTHNDRTGRQWHHILVKGSIECIGDIPAVLYWYEVSYSRRREGPYRRAVLSHPYCNLREFDIGTSIEIDSEWRSSYWEYGYGYIQRYFVRVDAEVGSIGVDGPPELWTCLSSVVQDGADGSFKVHATGPFHREESLSYYERMKQCFQRWKDEMG